MLVRGKSERDYSDLRPRIHRQRGRSVLGSAETQQEGRSPARLTQRLTQALEGDAEADASP